jgi:uncharacterized protein
MSRCIVRFSGIVVLLGASAALLAGVQSVSQGRIGVVQDQPSPVSGSCPSGQTEIRPGICRPPEFPPPTILEYRPRSTLVSEENVVTRARFPVVDVHGHARGLTSPGRIDAIVAALDELNIQVYIVADNLSGEGLASAVAAIEASPHRNRFRLLAGIDFTNVQPGWGERAARRLEADIAAGAIGVGEISKSFGLRITRADGDRLRIDDPELDPVWETLARHRLPVLLHTGEPQEFFEPVDFQNERWLELALFPDRRNAGSISFDELMQERDNLFRRHPNTTFIAAHFGWHANDLGRAARMLDEFPNVYLEVGVILYDLGRQPRAAREFFIRYQDRILFGKDGFQPSEYPYFWRVFETGDEYFDYYRGYHAFWKLYGMELPHGVLRKLYHGNALELFAGLPRDGFTP